MVMPVHVSDSCEQPLGELKQRRFGQKPSVLDRNSQKSLVPADHFENFGMRGSSSLDRFESTLRLRKRNSIRLQL